MRDFHDDLTAQIEPLQVEKIINNYAIIYLNTFLADNKSYKWRNENGTWYDQYVVHLADTWNIHATITDSPRLDQPFLTVKSYDLEAATMLKLIMNA
jgi:hypothetical protein